MRNKAINILLFLLFLSLLGYATAWNAQLAEAAAVADARITDINIMDNAVEINIDGDFTYKAYKPSDPFSVSVDLPNVDKGDYNGKLTSDKEGISEVNVSGSSAPSTDTKLDILLVSPSQIKTVKKDGSLLIQVEDKEDTMMMAQADTSGEQEMSTTKIPMKGNLPAAKNINNVAFDYSDGNLKLVIQGDGAMAANVYSINRKIIVDVPNVTLNAEMPAAVVAPVKAIRSGSHDGAVRLVIDLQKEVEFKAATVENKVVISMPADEVLEILTPEETPAEEAAKATTAEAAAAGEEGAEGPKYTGKIISLDFQNADIVPIFRFIGDISGYNVVVHPSVAGTVTLKLKNVPWDQALDIILNIYSLEKQIEGNIMTIAPSSVFDKIAKERAQRKKTDEVTAELEQRRIHLDYIDVADMEKEIKDRKILSPRGTITPDPKGNDLWVKDTSEVIDTIYPLVKHFDKAIYGKQQIMVEARIVIVEAPYSKEIGIQWGATQLGVKLLGTPVTGDFAINNPLSIGSSGSYTARAQIPGAFTGTAPYASLNLTLSALETVNKSKTISNPRVLTLNGEQAKIQSGTQIPVSTTTAEGSTTQFINANLSLDVTPDIKPNNVIELKVKVNKDEPTAVGGQTGINTKSVETIARVKDGETLVLGGIYENTLKKEKSGVPGLRKIPILGWLFGSDLMSDRTDELLILITPRIIKD